jgi:hypothetical protein
MILLHSAGGHMKFHPARVRRRMTVVGVFDDDHLARQALRELSKVGFDQHQIRVSERDGQGLGNDLNLVRSVAPGSHFQQGRRTVPLGDVDVRSARTTGVETAFTRNASSVTPSSADGPTGTGGLFGVLAGAGMAEHEAKYYRDEFEAGRTVVTIAAGSREAEAKAILRRHGSYDMISGIQSHATR